MLQDKQKYDFGVGVVFGLVCGVVFFFFFMGKLVYFLALRYHCKTVCIGSIGT